MNQNYLPGHHFYLAYLKCIREGVLDIKKSIKRPLEFSNVPAKKPKLDPSAVVAFQNFEKKILENKDFEIRFRNYIDFRVSKCFEYL